VPPPLAAGDQRRLDGNAAHYLAQVMRVAPGDAVILLDDATGEWAARVEDVAKRAVTVTIVERLRPRETPPDLWLCAAPVKKPHFDMMIEKATELGIARIVPVLTRRSVVDKVNAERVHAIITEAAEQCARTALPALDAPVKLEALLRGWPAERALFFADEHGGDAPLAACAAHRGPAALLIGPEGGFDDAAISLGPRILRAETAAIAAITLWMAAAGDWPDAAPVS
jgi:16S rRNA (uracil1498-N3)-methyltransferase